MVSTQPKSAPEDFFPKIGTIAADADAADAEDENGEGGGGDKPITEIESLCMKCGEQGITRMMLTTIPFFRQIIVMSFKCEHCGTSNNEIQSASDIRPQGTIYTTHVHTRADLSRQLVRSSSCTVYIPTFELTLPAPLEAYIQDPHNVPRPSGVLSTIEGFIRNIIADLSMGQPLRRAMDQAAYDKIETILEKLKEVVGDDDDDEQHKSDAKDDSEDKQEEEDKDKPFPPFTFQLNDPAGNSFIEFISSTPLEGTNAATSDLPGKIDDPRWSMRTYERSKEQDILLGLAEPDAAGDDEEKKKAEEKKDEEELDEGEVYVFPGTCSSCRRPLDTKMKKVNVPYFKDILIMSTNCQYCGYRDNEIKSGSAISEKGKKITLKIDDRDDLSRDLLKSETAALTIPEIDLHLTHGTLGGRFTTVEGILTQVYEELGEKVFFAGDSAQKRLQEGDGNDGDTETEKDKTYNKFLNSLKALFEERGDGVQPPFTLILDDPLANSYLQNLYAPDDDPNMKIETYERSFEQNEELGLNDIDVGESGGQMGKRAEEAGKEEGKEEGKEAEKEAGKESEVGNEAVKE